MQWLLAIIFSLWIPEASAQSVESKAVTPHLEARLVSELSAVQPGKPFSVALHFKLKPGWHTYWQNPGDSGEPVKLRWVEDANFKAGRLEFPVPQRIERAPLANYGYLGEVAFLTEIRPAKNLPAGSMLSLPVEASWLVCEEECIPEKARLELKLPVAGASLSDPEGANLIAVARQRLPRPWTGAMASLRTQGGELNLVIPEASGKATDWEFFPLQAGVMENYPRPTAQRQGSDLEFQLRKSPAALTDLAGISGVLSRRDPDGTVTGYSLQARVPSHFPGILIFLAAFAGGLLLNLMPCVFPVLSLKVLGFVHQAQESPRRVRRHAYGYAAGILISFWILAGLLLLLRHGGSQLGWGFQLQSPSFVLVLIILLFALGLSLFGLFHWGESWMGWGDQLTRKPGYAGSFFSGVLATVVATPCMAPLVGSTLGVALTQRAWVSLALFTALALGLAAPYVLFALFPRLLRLLPKPGRWMEVFQQFMGFLMLGTVLWLLWVFGLQTSQGSLFRLLIVLLLLAFGLWAVPRLTAGWGGRVGRPVAGLLLLAVFGLAVVSGLKGIRLESTSEKLAEGMLPWQDFSENRLEELRAQGKPVFINFTAAWCLTCQVNERLVFSSPEVREAFAAKGVELLKADWTQQDAEIARALAGYERQGVPVYVLYAPGQDSKPRLLPEVLSAGVIQRALEAI